MTIIVILLISIILVTFWRKYNVRYIANFSNNICLTYLCKGGATRVRSWVCLFYFYVKERAIYLVFAIGTFLRWLANIPRSVAVFFYAFMVLIVWLNPIVPLAFLLINFGFSMYFVHAFDLSI